MGRLPDRFSDATYAYQVVGLGLDAAKYRVLEQSVHPGQQPDLTFLFDIAPAVAAQRLAQGRADTDRFEREQRDFFERVRAAYLSRAQESGGRIVVVDASRAPDEVTADVLGILDRHLS